MSNTDVHQFCCYYSTYGSTVILCHDFFAFGRLLSIAEETLTEFLSKATGTAVDWVQMPGMKVFFSCLYIVYVSHMILKCIG